MRSYVLPALSASLLAAASTMALAADLPSRRAPPVFVPPPPIPVFTWTGLFVGGNAGAAFDQRYDANNFLFPAGSIAGSTGSAGALGASGVGSKTSFAGGAQIGYNYELGGAGFGGVGGLFGPTSGIVVGVVADAQYLDNHSNVSNANYAFTPTTPLSVGNAFVNVPGLPRTIVNVSHQREDFFGTARGRLGVAFDRVFVYGTGGLAYNTHTTGYTFGGGFEYAITNNVTVGAEYLYVNLNRGAQTGTATYVPSPGLGAGVLTIDARGGRDTFNVARAVLNYKFDFLAPLAAPVVARY